MAHRGCPHEYAYPLANGFNKLCRREWETKASSHNIQTCWSGWSINIGFHARMLQKHCTLQFFHLLHCTFLLQAVFVEVSRKWWRVFIPAQFQVTVDYFRCFYFLSPIPPPGWSWSTNSFLEFSTVFSQFHCSYARESFMFHHGGLCHICPTHLRFSSRAGIRRSSNQALIVDLLACIFPAPIFTLLTTSLLSLHPAHPFCFLFSIYALSLETFFTLNLLKKLLPVQSITSLAHRSPKCDLPSLHPQTWPTWPSLWLLLPLACC